MIAGLRCVTLCQYEAVNSNVNFSRIFSFDFFSLYLEDWSNAAHLKERCPINFARGALYESPVTACIAIGPSRIAMAT